MGLVKYWDRYYERCSSVEYWEIYVVEYMDNI